VPDLVTYSMRSQPSSRIGRECAREHRHFLDGADRHGSDRCLTAQASSLFAPSSVKVVVRREPAPVVKYVWLTNRSPYPSPAGTPHEKWH